MAKIPECCEGESMIRLPIRMITDSSYEFGIIVYGENYHDVYFQIKEFIKNYNKNLKGLLIKGDHKSKIIHCYTQILSGGNFD